MLREYCKYFPNISKYSSQTFVKTANMPSEGDEPFGCPNCFSNECFPPLKSSDCPNETSCLGSARNCICFRFHWPLAPWGPGRWRQEEAQGTAQRDERVFAGLRGLAVWSQPAEEIYLAGSDAAHCVMTPEDCAVGKQTGMAWLQPSLLLPLPAGWPDRDCERLKEALTTEEPP